MNPELRRYATALILGHGTEPETTTIHELADEHLGRAITDDEADLVESLIANATVTVSFDIPFAPDKYPGRDGTIGPGPRQYASRHGYARDVFSGAGNCVCGAALGAGVHVEAAPGVPVPDTFRS